MSCIFLSHSSVDNFEAVALRDWLASQGWDDVFLDLDPDRGIAAGERWERALHEAPTRCEAVIFLVSGNWLTSGWCVREYTLARALNKRLFAVIIDPGKAIADLPPELKGTWQVVALTGGQDGLLLKTPLPGSHEERHVVFSKEGLRRLKHGLEKAGLDPKFFAWPPASDPQRAPCRGLKPLEGVDAGIFFGRDAPIVEATDKLRGLSAAAAPRVLVILGASGAGKSSFLRAGLLPRLARDDRNFLVLSTIRPELAALTGENVLLGALKAALPNRTGAELRRAIQAGAAGVRPLLNEFVAAELKGMLTAQDQAKPPVVVLAIDQAEELFRADGSGEGWRAAQPCQRVDDGRCAVGNRDLRDPLGFLRRAGTRQATRRIGSKHAATAADAPNTRAAYAVAVRAFFAWPDAKHVEALPAVRTHHVSAYVEVLARTYRAPTVKQHLAAIRMLFDWLIVGQIFAGPNPAAAVRGPKHVVKKGKTSVLDGDEAKKLLDSIDVSTVVGLRDRARWSRSWSTPSRASRRRCNEHGRLLSAGQTLVGAAAREGRQAARDAGASPARTFSRRLPYGAAPGRRRRTRQGLAFVPHARRPRPQTTRVGSDGAAGCAADDRATRGRGRNCHAAWVSHVSGDRHHGLSAQRRVAGIRAADGGA